MEITRSPEIEALQQRMWQAFADASEATLRNLLIDDSCARFILSGDDEWFGSTVDLPAFMARRGERIDVERIEIDRSEAFQRGDSGWSAHEITVTLREGAKVSFRQTGTWVLQDGQWRIVQIHTSRGVPPEETFGYEVAHVLADLVDSLTTADAAGIAAASGTSGIVTLMFTDIEDSTRLSQDVGDAVWINRVQAHFSEIEQVVGAGGGVVVKTLGDGAMAAFPTVRGAANAALAIQRSERDPGLRVRIGIHTGEAFSLGTDYAGVTVAKAARVASAASGGEILVSSTSQELLDRFEFTMGEERNAELKGLPGTHRLTVLVP